MMTLFLQFLVLGNVLASGNIQASTRVSELQPRQSTGVYGQHIGLQELKFFIVSGVIWFAYKNIVLTKRKSRYGTFVRI